MATNEARQLLITSLKRCKHGELSEVVYRRRLYPLCKTCFLKMTMAISFINGKQNPFALPKNQEYPSVTFMCAYIVHATNAGYQAEIFHIWNQTTLWVGDSFATKQRACHEADHYMVKFHQLCARTTQKRFVLHYS